MGAVGRTRLAAGVSAPGGPGQSLEGDGVVHDGMDRRLGRGSVPALGQGLGHDARSGGGVDHDPLWGDGPAAGVAGVLGHHALGDAVHGRVLPFVRQIDTDKIVDLAAGGDDLAVHVALTGTAAVQHDGGVPALLQELGLELLRGGAVGGAVETQISAFEAHGRSGPAAGQVAAIDEPLCPAPSQEADATDVVQLPRGGNAHQGHVRTGVPGVTPVGVGVGGVDSAVGLQVADGPVPLKEAAVEDVVRASDRFDLGQGLFALVDVDLHPPDAGERNTANCSLHFTPPYYQRVASVRMPSSGLDVSR